jgi:hypothetical protein
MAAPTMGATQNSHGCCSAHPPLKMATAVERAGFKLVLVTGMPMRWLSGHFEKPKRVQSS